MFLFGGIKKHAPIDKLENQYKPAKKIFENKTSTKDTIFSQVGADYSQQTPLKSKK